MSLKLTAAVAVMTAALVLAPVGAAATAGAGGQTSGAPTERGGPGDGVGGTDHRLGDGTDGGTAVDRGPPSPDARSTRGRSGPGPSGSGTPTQTPTPTSVTAGTDPTDGTDGTDGDTDTDTDTANLTAGPSAVVQAPPDASVGEPITFDASNSTAPTATPLVYAWDLTGDGTVDATGETVEWAFPTPGTHTVRLVVVGPLGRRATATASVRVTGPPGSGPTANATVPNRTLAAGESVVFDGSNSTAHAGGVVRYAWQFGDGTSATGERVVHEYDAPGTYTVRLTVTDRAGRTNRTTRTLRVAPADPSPVDIVRVVPDKRGSIINEVILRNTYTASLNATEPVERVSFRLRNRTYVDRNGSDGWSASVNVSVLNGDAPLVVTAVTENGTRDRYVAMVDVVDIPDWIVDVTRAGNVTYANGTLYMNRSLVTPPATVEFEPVGRVPVVGLRQYVYASAYFGIEYDMPDGTVVALAEGRIRLDPLELPLVPLPDVPTGEAAVSGRGYFVTDGEDWRLRRARVRGYAEVEYSVGYDVNRELPDPVPNVFPAAELVATPSLRADGTVTVRDDRLRLRDGTLSPGVTTSSIVALQAPGGSVRGELRGELSGAVDVPPPYDLRGSAAFEGELTVETAPYSGSLTVGPYRSGLGYGGSTASPNGVGTATVGNVEWTYPAREGDQPLAGAGGGVGTADATGGIDTADPGHGDAIPALSGPSAVVPPRAHDRLTADRVADRSTAAVALGGAADGRPEVGVAWSRQPPTKSTQAGRDVYWRRWTGEGWSDPVAVTDDRRYDLRPALAHDRTTNRTLAVWTRVSTRTNVSEPAPAAYDGYELAYAVRTADGWSGPRQLTDDVAFDAGATVAARDGRFVVAWTRDGDADMETTDDRGVEVAVLGSAGAGDGADDRESRAAKATTRTGPAVSVLARGDVANATDPVVGAGTADGFRIGYRTPPGSHDGSVVVGRVAAGPTDGSGLAPVRVSRERRLAVAGYADAAAAGDRVIVADGGPTAARLRAVDATDVRRLAAGARLRGVRELSATARAGHTTVSMFARPAGHARGGLVALARDPRGDRAGDREATAHATDTAVGGNATGSTGTVESGESRGASGWSGPRVLATAPGPNLTLWGSALATTDGGPVVTYAVTGPEADDRGDVFATRATESAVGAAPSGGLPAGGKRSTGTADPSGDGSVAATAVGVEPRLRLGNVTVDRYGDRLVVSGTVSNVGNRAADVVVASLSDRGGNRTLTRRRGPEVAAGDVRRVALAVDAATLERGTTIRLAASPRVETPLGGLGFAGTGDTEPLRPLRPALSVRERAVATYEAGNRTVASVTVANRGTGPGTTTVALERDGRVLAAREVTVPAPESDVAHADVRLSTPRLSDGETVTVTLTSDFEADATDNAARVVVRSRPAPGPFPEGFPRVTAGLPPTDVDADGVYEDIDGDGAATYADVVALFRAMGAPDLAGRAARVDFNGNGRLDFADVVALFDEVANGAA